MCGSMRPVSTCSESGRIVTAERDSGRINHAHTSPECLLYEGGQLRKVLEGNKLGKILGDVRFRAKPNNLSSPGAFLSYSPTTTSLPREANDYFPFLRREHYASHLTCQRRYPPSTSSSTTVSLSVAQASRKLSTPQTFLTHLLCCLSHCQ